MLKQLSGMDSLFLYTENHRAPLEVGCLQIYDPSTAPNGEVRFKEILATFQERLDRIDLFRQKLIEVPFSLDYPYWTEDRDFDLEYHVRHISLPKPGDWEQLMAQVARLQARQLDHTRPLWMAHVIGGLGNIPGFPEGAFAVFMKFHHAAIDGATGQDVQALMHDREPLQADASSYRPSIGPGDDNKPGTFSLLARTPFNTALRS
ncbi:MAG: wax ester/triacylglycerol synthase family O-acyltransferase, partial [Gammaproteobacteria bacterium]|nr:wax ester/triacylglycerol synthase family O-acyltransferase [Gammaproteobacteria bacterium]